MRKIIVALFLVALMASPAFAATFTNGSFESGFTGWTLSGTGGTGDSAIVGVGTDPNTNNVLPMVTGVSATNIQAARVNDQYGGFHTSTISQTVNDWTDAAIWFAWAAVLQEPTNNVYHSDTQAPDFSVKLIDLTTSSVLYDQTWNVYNYASWNNGVTNYVAGSEGIWKYTNWISVSLPTTTVVGDDLQLIISATDCSLSGHGGYIYVDQVGSTPPVGTPEPATMLLLGLGLVGLAGVRRKIQK